MVWVFMECNDSHGEKDFCRCKNSGTMNRANWPKTYFKLCRAPIKSITLAEEMVHEAQWEKWAEKWHISSLSEGLPCAGRNRIWSNGYSDEQRLNTIHLDCCLKRLHPMTYMSSKITQLPLKYTQRSNNYKISVNSRQKLKQVTALLMKYVDQIIP